MLSDIHFVLFARRTYYLEIHFVYIPVYFAQTLLYRL